jgi:CDP-diacylglycerol--glycerol-3-phosphate 3-phosphatidyltransferase
MMGIGGKFLTAANIVSIARIPLSGFACLSVAGGHTAAAAVFVALAICSDWVDGLLARATGTVSDWGKVLDPLADKLGIAAFLVTLTVLGRVALWFTAVIVLRDLAIAAAGLCMIRRLPSVPSSSVWGKLSTVLVSLHLTRQALAPAVQWPGEILPGLDVLGTSALCVAVLSLALYASRALGQLDEAAIIHRKRTTCT